MILKRPQGKFSETPDQLRQRLLKTWDQRVKEHLSSQDSGNEEIWPLEVNIGQPKLVGEALIKNVVEIRQWINIWRTPEPALNVQFAEKNPRRVGRLTIPERIIFDDIDALARYLGPKAQKDLEIARARFADLAVIDPRLSGMAPNWRGVTDMSDTEHNGACDFLAQRQFSQEDNQSIREMVIAGVGGKFLEKRKAILEGALEHMDMLKEGEDYRERLGFRSDDRQTLWIKAHPDDMSGPFGAQQFAVRPSEIKTLPASIRQITIVENVETFYGYDPEPGVCLFFGSGNAISGMAVHVEPLRDLPVVYWGDLDSFGMKILSRLRQVLPQTSSTLMDIETMNGVARDLWRPEPQSDRYTGDVSGLTQDEQAALDLIRQGHHRIEQEHLRPKKHHLARLGLHRVS